MRVSDAFPSNYLKASDLQGRNVTVKIDRVEFEKIGDENRLALYFKGKQKAMVLNKTNANNISAVYGDETEAWEGQEVTLYEAMVDYQGRSVPAIRIRVQRPRFNGQITSGQEQLRKQATPPSPPAPDPDLDDPIPF